MIKKQNIISLTIIAVILISVFLYFFTPNFLSVFFLRQSANQGNNEAQYKLGKMYKTGEGVDMDAFKAIEWFTKSAEQNNAKAQYELGMSYESGYSVPQDYSKAIELLKKSAEQNNAEAQYELGYMFNPNLLPFHQSSLANRYTKEEAEKISKEYFKQSCLNKNQYACDAYKRSI